MAPWAVPADMEFTSCAAADPDDVLAALALASDVLYELSGRLWPGVATDVVRPCSPLRGGGPGWCGCASPRVCGCRAAPMVELPGNPAVAVTEVVLDGVVLADTAYRLMGQLLVRTDDGRWPCCQDWAVPGDQPGGFQVEYTWGAAPPAVGVGAAASLACELYRAQQGDVGCRLPKRVTTVSRQGVSFALLDPLTLFADGLTGLPEVDLWLSSLRWGQKHRSSTVVVPGQRARLLRDTVPPVVPGP